MNVIEIHGLRKCYGSLTAVDDLNLTIGQGEFFALLGVNGAGKTTTIKMLSCLTLPTAGDAKLLGRSICTEAEQVKRVIAVSPQETAIAPNLSVTENLEFLAGIHGLSKEAAKARTAEMLETLGLQPVAKQRAKTLSGGWQRRYAGTEIKVDDEEYVIVSQNDIIAIVE